MNREEGPKLINKSPIIRITSAYSTDSNKEQDQTMALTTSNNIKLDQMPSNMSDMESGASGQLEQTGEQPCSQQQMLNRTTHAYKRRWLILAIFCAHSAINSFQWIQYSSITNIVSTYYGVSNLEVNLTSLVYMITYIPFIIHASLMLERVGLRYAICLGVTGTALGSIIKFEFGNSPTTFSFWGLMAGQTVVALSQLYIISIPPLIAAVWFPDHQVSTATGIGVFGNQLGIALGFIVPPLLVSDSTTPKSQIGMELYSLERGVAILSMLIFIIACICTRDKPPKPPGSASLHAANQQREDAGAGNDIETFTSIRQLCRDRDFQLLTLSYGINVGCFYAVSTVLNQMVAKNWPNPDDLAGTMGLLIVVSGMVGSVMCGQLLDRTHAYKLIIVLIYLLSLVSMLLFTVVLRLLTGPWPLYVVSVTLGFFMTGYLPLGFEFAAEITYPHPANTPAGLLNLSAQVSDLLTLCALNLSCQLLQHPTTNHYANLFDKYNRFLDWY